jgi:hypothetical protein
MFEAPVFADNLSDIENGNVTNVNYIGPKPVLQPNNIFELLQNNDDESDTEAEIGQDVAHDNEVSDASSDLESEEDEMETTAVKVGGMHTWTA